MSLKFLNWIFLENVFFSRYFISESTQFGVCWKQKALVLALFYPSFRLFRNIGSLKISIWVWKFDKISWFTRWVDFQNIHITNVNVSHPYFPNTYGDQFYLQHITSLLPKDLWQPILPADAFRVVDSFETNELGIGKNIT